MTTSAKKLKNPRNEFNYDFLEVGGTVTYDDIEAQFKEYCQEYSCKGMKSNKSSLKRATSSKLFHTPATLPSVGLKHTESSVSFAARSAYVDNLTTGTMDTMDFRTETEDPSLHKLYTLTKGPGQSGIQLSDEEINQLCQEFTISIPVLSNLQTPADKHKYIIECMQKRVKDDMRELDKKHNVRLNHILNFEEEFQKTKARVERDSADIYKWLDINTSHEPLKKKLRFRLAETLHDHDNLSRVEASMDEIRKSRDSVNVSSMKKITIENVPIVDNYEILKDTLGGQSDNLLKMTKGMKHSHRKGQEQSIREVSVNDTSRMKDFSKEEATLQTEEDVTTSRGPKDNWSSRKERAFKLHREDAKGRLFDKVKSSNWNALGFSPLVQASQKNEKSRLQRDTKLANYMNGDLLTPEEYKLLANTSTTLNKFVDKEYLQTVVDYMDPDIIQAIEIDLAEETLKDFQKRNKEVRETRLGFLKDRNSTIRTYIDIKEERSQKRMQTEEGKEVHKKITKKALSLLDKVEERKKRKNKGVTQETKPKPEPAKEGPPLRVGLFANKFLNVVHKKHEVKLFKLDKDFLRRLQPFNTQKNKDNLKMSQHHYHPPSKIIVKTDPNQQKDFLGLGTDLLNSGLARRKNESQETYKLHIHSQPQFKAQTKFKDYYSGGPIDDESRTFHGHYTMGDISRFKVESYKIPIIKKIQAAWRGYRQRKVFKRMQEKEIEKQRLARRKDRILKQGGNGFLKAVVMADTRPQDRIPSKRLEIQQNGFVFKSPKSHSVEKPHGLNSVLSLLGSPKVNDAPASSREPDNLKIMDKSRGSFRALDRLTPRVDGESKDSNRAEKALLIERPKTAMSKTSSSITFKGKGKMMIKQAISRPENASAVMFSETDGFKEEIRNLKIVQRAAPKGLLLKQRKLITAAKTDSFNIIKASGFKYYEADVNVQDDNGNTPLYYAAKWGNKDICEFLVHHRANVNILCSGGDTALHMAFASGQIMIVILLLSHGGNLNILNDNRQTPIAFGSESLLSLLNLKTAVATYNEYTPTRMLPKELDNNKYLTRLQGKSTQNKDNLSFDYKHLKQDRGKVDSENKIERSFVAPV